MLRSRGGTGRGLAIAIAVALGSAGGGAAAHAQAPGGREARVQVTPYAGYATFGDYFDAPAGARFTNGNAAIVGAQVGVALSPAVAIVGNLGYARSNWRLNDVPLLGDIDLADAGIWLYDVGVQLRLPLGARGGSRLVPFAQAGVGAIRYTLRDDAIAELVGADGATNFAGNVGVGVDVRLTPSVGLRLMAKDYVASFRAVEADAFRAEGRVAHSFAFTAGVTVGF